MKSLKKTLVLLVVFSMILSAVMPAFAAGLTDIYGLDCEEEVARLEALGVVSGVADGNGNPTGEYRPEETVTRAQMAVILCKMVGIDEFTTDENKVVPSKFSDVKVGEWYTGFVNVAAGKGLLSGYPDGTFRPDEQLTMNHVLTLCVNALGRGEYVSEMGTWPANYIAEATKLGLLDGVKSSDANRGNVAIIVWNTLEAPYVWDVNSTEYEGSINLGNVSRSLLSIHFRDYMNITENADGKETYAFKEIEHVSVAYVPSMVGTLGEKQIVLDLNGLTLTAEEDAFVKGIDTKVPRREDSKEWTTRNGNLITAHAPELEELNSYYGKVVTVIFGEDNKLVSIRVVDDTVEDQFLTAWEDNKLTIGGTKYKFSKKEEAVISINTVTEGIEGMEDVENALSIPDMTDITKVIKANVRLDNDGNVARLDLFVSGNFDAVNTRETIVSKVRNEIITLKNGVEINYGEDGEYEEEEDRPRIMKDNEIISIEDIAAGDVLTYFVEEVENDLNDEVITTVYVASNKVDGELTRVSKTADKKLTVDGEKYLASATDVLFTDDKISDAKTGVDVTDYIGENVTLYLNVYGEYVLIASEETEEDLVFGIVTKVPEEAEEDEEDLDIYRMAVRILLADGTTARNYKFLYNEETDKDTISLGAWETKVGKLLNNLIIFAPDANGEIAINDYKVVEMDDETVAADVEAVELLGDYYAIKAIAPVDTDDDGTIDNSADKATVDADRERINSKVFGSNTAIFNIAHDDNGTVGDLTDDSYDPEVSKSWKVLVSGNELAQDAMLIYEKTGKTLAYVMINVVDYVTSDAQYAIVETDDYKEKRGSKTSKYTELLLADDSEATEFEATNINGEYTLGYEDYFVEYKLSGSKLSAANWLVDLLGFKALKTNADATEMIANTSDSKYETKLMLAFETHVAGDTTIAAADKTVCAKCEEKTTHKADCTENTADPVANEQKGCAVCGKLNGATHVEVEGEDTHNASLTTVAEETCAKCGATGTHNAACTLNTPDAVTTKTCAECLSLTAKHKADCTVGGYAEFITRKANFKVIATQKLLLEYADEDSDNVDYSFGELVLDEDVVIYDARGGELKTTTFSAIEDAIEAEENIYVIPFANADAEGYNGNDIANTDANILVIVD